MASADHAESTFRDVRGGLLRDALHHGAGARVLTHRARTLQPAKAIKSGARDSDSAGDLRRDSLHAAPVFAGHAVPDRSRETAPLLVQPVAAGVFLSLGHCRRISDDHLRIVDEFQAFRIATGAAGPAGTRPC